MVCWVNSAVLIDINSFLETLTKNICNFKTTNFHYSVGLSVVI
ncbi:Uncharacterised protein [Vibrio cholerae]|nr:Uncharacterised protein [Vibrio cholerae]